MQIGKGCEAAPSIKLVSVNLQQKLQVPKGPPCVKMALPAAVVTVVAPATKMQNDAAMVLDWPPVAN